MDERKENLMEKRIPFSVWKIEDRKLAMELWGDYRVDECVGERVKLLREVWNRRSCGEIYYPFFHTETRVLIGVCGLKAYDESKGVYEVDFYVREEWRSRTYEITRYMVRYAIEGTGAGVILAGRDNVDVSKGFLNKLGFEYMQCGSLRGRNLREVYYLKARI